MSVKKDDSVKVAYTGTLDNGTVFDSSEISFKVGAGQIIPGFEKAVIDMEVGQEKEVKLNSSECYGDYNPAMVTEIPRDKLPKEQEIKEGMMVLMGLPDGKQIPARISKVTDEKVTLDLNHPLAGKNLNFKIKIIEIS